MKNTRARPSPEKKSSEFTRRRFAPSTANTSQYQSSIFMFAAVRVPASRTSSQYVCYACRSQRVASLRPWRNLSTDSQTASQAQEDCPLPPNSKPAEALLESKLPPPDNDATKTGEDVQDVQISDSSRENASASSAGLESRRARLKRRIKSLEAAISWSGEGSDQIDGASPKLSASTGNDRDTSELPTSAQTGSDQRHLLRRLWKEKMGSKKNPAPLYTTISDAGVVRTWQAEYAFDGKKFKVEAPNKKAATTKMRTMIIEHLISMPPGVRPTKGKAVVERGTERSRGRVRTRKAIPKDLPVRVRKCGGRTSEESRGMSIKEALTGRRRSKATMEDAHKKDAMDSGLPPHIRSHYKPAEEVATVNASSLEVVPLHIPQSPVPPLSYGLDRVLFNPGVYRLRDPRSRVYNFDPYLERVVPAEEFDFAALKGYKVASTDPTLSNIAAENGLKYFTSTSSLTSVLMTFHFLISQWRPIDISMLSKTFEGLNETNFTTFTRAPTAIILKPKNGGYAIDKDDDGGGNTVLSLVGRSLEKLLTVPRKEFDKYRKSKVTGKSAIESPDTEEAFHYTGIGNVLVRSQLDGYDPRLPGSGIFDIKTRAVLPVRMDVKGKLEVASSYEIKDDHGNFQSFEREYHDMLRAPMLKYSMQARLGRMDGIFVAYHNISRMFGFQYVSLPEIDRAIHGSTDTFRGDQELRASINILQDVLDRASSKFPDQPLRMMFETRPGDHPFMNIFVEPVTFEYLEERAIEKQRRVNEYERAVTDPEGAPASESPGKPTGELTTAVNEQVQEGPEFDDSVKLDSSDSLRKLLTARQAPAEATSSTKSAIQRIQELLAGYSTQEAKEADTASQLAQAQELAVNIIRETSKFRESDVTDARRSTRREELLKLNKANIKLEKSLDALDSKLVPDVANTDYDDQVARLRDVMTRTSEECKSLKSSHYDSSGPILALALTVRNKVNGHYVSGPPDVNRNDEWDIEYSIQEMEDHSKAWEGYDACVARRDNASAMSKDDPEAIEKWYGGHFMRELAKWSRKGAEWRLEQDEIDRSMGRKEVFEPIDKSVIVLDEVQSDDLVKEELGKGVVDEYMTWLFSGKGGSGKKE
ncbi:hypothetical protein FKW77_009051 [Venturia effusa]|uniref:Pet127-domain-containing protein n=1 Tax=Venturia effusa TaxID=50376 RepID=A0A517L403_9PEZI|nr:hypothetical protein FKW77_009051 [Venturia effusa]